MRYRAFLLGVVVTSSACFGSEAPSGLTDEASDPIQSDVEFNAGADVGPPPFVFLPPLGSYTLPAGSQVDASLQPDVTICPTSVGECTAANAVAAFSRTDGTAGERIEIPAHGEFFQVEWQTSASSVQPGESFRIHVSASGLTLGTLDIALTASAGSLPVGATALIRFYADSLALRSAVGCTPGSGSVIDCDVVQVIASTGNTATVYDAQGRLAGQVVIPAGLANQNHILQLEHRSNAPAPPAIVPVGDQYPYHLSVTTTSMDGSPVTIGGSGARIVLCQDPSIDQRLPHSLHDALEVLRVDAGAVQRLPTTPGAPECSLRGPLPAPIGKVASAFSPRTWLTQLYRFVGPTPLVALHGGLNTSSGGFSEFTAILGVNALASTASANVGGVGAPTTVTVQARTAVGTPFPLGGDQVAGQVSGANPGALTATDLGNGMYTLTYTAQTAGSDVIDLTLNGKPLGLGPLVIDQRSPAQHLVEAVVLFNGVGAANVRVVVEGPVRQELVTDANGQARFAGLPPGDYDVAVVGGIPVGSVVQPGAMQPVSLPTDKDTIREVVFDVLVPS